MGERKCFLRPVDATHEPIPLLDNTPIAIGRGPVTKIKDSRCSRTQVLLVADFANYVVKATQLGRNSCGLAGLEMKKDKPVEIQHGQKLDILLGQYSYTLEFDPPPGKKILEEPEKGNVNDVSDSDDEVLAPPDKKSRLVPPAEKIANLAGWEQAGRDLLVYKTSGVVNSSRIAAFDLDHTVITTTSGHTFPKRHDDWRIMYPEILAKLMQNHKYGYKIVIFTNQASLITTALITQFQQKIMAVVDKLKVPTEVYVASGKSNFRKPCPGMWQAMVERNGGVEVNIGESFYCGDAAGRQASKDLFKTDHSQCDILFARNLGLKFYTPEEYFLGVKDNRSIKITAFNPRNLPCDLPLCDPEHKQVTAHRQELVLLVGSPGSGKSHFAVTHMVPAGYKRVSRDELGTMAKCIQSVEAYLKSGSHVVVDNTNPTVQARAKFVDRAKELSIPARVFIMNTTQKHAVHNNMFRQLTNKSHSVVGDVIIQNYFKSYEEPKMEEGFSEIVKINFWPTFSKPEHEKLYNMTLTDK